MQSFRASNASLRGVLSIPLLTLRLLAHSTLFLMWASAPIFLSRVRSFHLLLQVSFASSALLSNPRGLKGGRGYRISPLSLYTLVVEEIVAKIYGLRGIIFWRSMGNKDPPRYCPCQGIFSGEPPFKNLSISSPYSFCELIIWHRRIVSLLCHFRLCSRVVNGLLFGRSHLFAQFPRPPNLLWSHTFLRLTMTDLSPWQLLCSCPLHSISNAL